MWVVDNIRTGLQRVAVILGWKAEAAQRREQDVSVSDQADLAEVEQIKALAEGVIDQIGPLSGMDFGYNRESVEWLEGYIDHIRGREAFAGDAIAEGAINKFGAFLGECFVRCQGGVWVIKNGDWGVDLGEGVVVLPRSKVAKQWRDGREFGDGIAGFFNMAPAVVEAGLGREEPNTE